jgi:hypothetical protein
MMKYMFNNEKPCKSCGKNTTGEIQINNEIIPICVGCYQNMIIESSIRGN